MKILVVGAEGVLGSALVELLISLNHQVTCVDLDNVNDLPQMAKDAEVAFIAVPISQIAGTIKELASAMERGSLIVSGGSVAEPIDPNAIDFQLIREKGITFALLHLMFKPERPLRTTIFGQNIALAIEGNETGSWQDWIEEQFIPLGPIFHHLDRNEHDRATAISQIFHMITAVMAAELWNATPETELTIGAKTGGFPCQSVIRSVLRSMGTKPSSVVGEILKSHPHVPATLAILRSALDKIEQSVQLGSTTDIEENMGKARESIEKKLLDEIDWTAEELIRLEADFRKPKRGFDFPPKMNQPGLLARVMAEFDCLGVNKTSTFAHNLPDGGCRFIIGFESIDCRVEGVEKNILSWNEKIKKF